MFVMDLGVAVRNLWVHHGSVHTCAGFKELIPRGCPAPSPRALPGQWLLPNLPLLATLSLSPTSLHISKKNPPKQNSEGLNSFFHHFPSTFGVSVAALSPPAAVPRR